jgi:hypothetical protein
MTITEYLSGLGIMFGSLVAVLGVAAGIVRRRSSH